MDSFSTHTHISYGGHPMTHSPEPWKLETGFNYENTPDRERWVQVLDAHRKMVLYDAAKGEHADQILADLERITACINACAGIPTEELQRVAEGKARIACTADGEHVIVSYPDFFEPEILP